MHGFPGCVWIAGLLCLSYPWGFSTVANGESNISRSFNEDSSAERTTVSTTSSKDASAAASATATRTITRSPTCLERNSQTVSHRASITTSDLTRSRAHHTSSSKSSRSNSDTLSLSVSTLPPSHTVTSNLREASGTASDTPTRLQWNTAVLHNGSDSRTASHTIYSTVTCTFTRARSPTDSFSPTSSESAETTLSRASWSFTASLSNSFSAATNPLTISQTATTSTSSEISLTTSVSIASQTYSPSPEGTQTTSFSSTGSSSNSASSSSTATHSVSLGQSSTDTNAGSISETPSLPPPNPACPHCPSTSTCIGGCCNATGVCRSHTCRGNGFGSNVAVCPLVPVPFEKLGWLWNAEQLREPHRRRFLPAEYPTVGRCVDGVCPAPRCGDSGLGSVLVDCMSGCFRMSCHAYGHGCKRSCLGVTVGGPNAGKLCVTTDALWSYYGSEVANYFQVCSSDGPSPLVPPSSTPATGPVQTTHAPPTLAPTQEPTTAAVAPSTVAPTTSPHTTEIPTTVPSVDTATTPQPSTAAPLDEQSTVPVTLAPGQMAVTASPDTRGEASSEGFTTERPILPPAGPASSSSPCLFRSGAWKTICMRVGSPSSCATHCLGYVLCLDWTDPTCVAIAGSPCIRHEQEETFTVCDAESPPSSSPSRTMDPSAAEEEPTFSPTPAAAFDSPISATASASRTASRVPQTPETQTPMSGVPQSSTSSPIASQPLATPRPMAVPTVAPTPAPTAVVFRCRFVCAASMDYVALRRDSLSWTLSRVLRCPQRNVFIRSIRAGSTIVDAEIVDSPLSEKAAGDALREDALNLTSELFTSFAVVASSLNVTLETPAPLPEPTDPSVANPTELPTPQPSTPANSNTDVPTAPPIPKRASVAVIVAVIVVVVSLGIVGSAVAVVCCHRRHVMCFAASEVRDEPLPRPPQHPIICESISSSPTISPCPLTDDSSDDFIFGHAATGIRAPHIRATDGAETTTQTGPAIL